MQATQVNVSELKQARKNCEAIVQDVLNLPTSNGWSVCDVQNNLALVHYEYDFSRMSRSRKVHDQRYNHLRGTIVDIKQKRVLATSFGYTPTAIAKKLLVKNQIVTLADEEGVFYDYDVNNLVIRRVFEGVVFRVFWYEGKMHLSTHKKINAEKSHWGESKSFTEMYHEAQGPKAEDLFDTTKKYSSVCYFFMVVHPQLFVATKQHVVEPYLVFLEKFRINLEGIPESEIDHEIRTPKNASSELSIEVRKSFCHIPQNLTIDEANVILSRGFFSEESEAYDPRLALGEAVIVYHKTSSGISQVLKVHSPSYDWRCKLRCNNSNIELQYYNLLSDVCRKGGKTLDVRTLQKQYCLVPVAKERIKNFPVEDIEEIFRDLMEFQGRYDQELLNDHGYLEFVIWMNYLYSLPVIHQNRAYEIFYRYQKNKKKLVKFFVANAKSQNGIDMQQDLLKNQKLIRLVQITALLRDSVRRRLTDKELGISARGLLNKEDPPSLYIMIKFIDELYNRPEKLRNYFNFPAPVKKEDLSVQEIDKEEMSKVLSRIEKLKV